MRPIFVGGCDRSGTTMLGAMLGAHPRHLCTPESYFKFDLLRDPRFDRATVAQLIELELLYTRLSASHRSPKGSMPGRAA